LHRGSEFAGGALFFRATDPELKAKVAALLRETNQQLKRLDQCPVGRGD